MPAKTVPEEALLQMAREVGLIRPRDLERCHIPRRVLYLLAHTGELVRVGRGLYRLPEADFTENHSFAEVAARVPNGVICLLSALRFHELTTELPSEVWVALGPKTWSPTFKRPRLRVVRFSGAALREGVETHDIEGVPVRMYSVAKTIADCFKFRNKIGTSVAAEALRQAWATRRVSADELWTHAVHCRVTNVMRPYLENLT